MSKKSGIHIISAAVMTALIFANVLTPHGGVFGFLEQQTGVYVVQGIIIFLLVLGVGITLRIGHTLHGLFAGTLGLLLYLVATWLLIAFRNGAVITGTAYTLVYLLPLLWTVQGENYTPTTLAGRLLSRISVGSLIAIAMFISGVELYIKGLHSSWLVLSEIGIANNPNVIGTVLIACAIGIVFGKFRGQRLLLLNMPFLFYSVFVTVRLLQLGTSYPPIALWLSYILIVTYIAILGGNEHDSNRSMVTDTAAD